MDLATQRLMQAAAGAGGDGEYIDDIFSVTARQGTSATKQITNGIDFAGEGGLVITKLRAATGGPTEDWTWVNTERGAGKRLTSNDSNAEATDSAGSTSSFNSNGYTIPSGQRSNYSTGTYVDFCFRKAPGFFDVVTYTGNGTGGTSISHNLNSVPGMMIVKKTSGGGNWAVYHRAKGANYVTYLNLTSAGGNSGSFWWNTAPTSTHFTVGNDADTNTSGATYVAYLFAHDEQIFGVGGNNSVIHCAQYTGNGSTLKKVTVGFEPQFVMVKNTSGNGEWYVADNMRGIFSDVDGHLHPQDPYIRFNSNSLESTTRWIDVTPNGFNIKKNSSDVNSSGANYIYMAVRRSEGYVGKPAEVGTDVFAIAAGTSNNDIPTFVSGFPADFTLFKQFAGSDAWYSQARLTGTGYMLPASNSPEASSSNNTWDFTNGFYKAQGNWSAFINWIWKRHAGFDVVAYKGNSTPGRTVQHNLSKIPEMIWIKCRGSAAENWVLGHIGLNGGTNPWEYSLRLNDTSAEIDYPYFNDTAPTSTLFTLNNNGQVNGSSTNSYLAMLFSSVDGISKVGYYTGTGADQTITTGFQPRFVFIKRADSGENGFVLDTTRGWASGNDNYLIINSNGAQVGSADFGNPVSTGFFVKGTNSGTNTNTGKYIYYAHA